MSSRGMGAINQSKMPKGKTIKRTDDPQDVETYAGGGLYANIAAKKKRIASGSGEKMRSAGSSGAPKKGDFANAAKTASYKNGGELKEVPEDNTGLSKLPTEVRNKMGYMKEGGKAEDEFKPYIQGQVNTDKYGTGGGGRAGFSRSVGKDADISAYIEGGGFKPKDGEFKGKVTGGGVTYNKRFAEGGKAKSKVNEAGNYTKPDLRKRIFNSVKAAAIVGTGAGKWSARKAQVMAKRYKAAGGGYRD